MHLVLSVILIFCCCFTTAHARQYVLLLTDDSSDKANLSADKPISIGTDTVRLVLNNLDGYNINIQHIPNARLNRFLETAPGSCAYNRIKTPQRSEKYAFSRPLNVYLSHRIYYLSAKGPLPDAVLEHGSVRSLQDLFVHFPNQKLALGKGRSYGKKLDAQIATLNQTNKILLTGQDIFYDLQKMLSKQRADFVIAFPDTISSVLVADSLPMSSYSIAGTDEFVVGRFACYPDSNGINFIYDVDKALGELFKNNQLLDTHLQHFHTSDHAILKDFFDSTLTELFSTPPEKSRVVH